MSSSSTALAAEVRALADQVARLTLRVSALESQASDPPSNDGSGILVEDPQERFSSTPLLARGPGTEQSPERVPPTTREARELLANQLGDWVLRALQGGRRGLSGREHLRSRIYVVFSDRGGPALDTARVFHRLRDLRGCLPGDDLENLIFLGFP